MPANRFYKIYVTHTYQNYAHTANIKLKDANGVNRAIIGNCTVTTDANPNGSLTNLIDETFGTFCSFLGGTDPSYDHWHITFDFGEGNSWDIATIEIENANTGGQGSIQSGNFSASVDGAYWLPYGGFSDRNTAASALTIHALVPPPAANVDILAQLPTVSAFTGAFVSAMPPKAVALAYTGGSSFISGSCATLASTGHDSTGEQAAYLTAPSPTLAVATGANAKSIRPSAPQLSTTGTVTTLAAASLVAPSAVLTSGGTVAAMAVAALSPPSPNLIGYGGAVVSVALAGGPTLQVTGTTGGVAGVTVAAPLFQLSSSAAQQNHGSVDILAPSPRMGGTLQAWLVAPVATLTAIGSAVITATYEAYAINLLQPLDSNPSNNYEAKVPAVTRYTHFPFTHVVRYQNSYYGANSTGLYLLEGTTDDGAPIPWAFKTAMTDFNTPNKKTVASAYFSGRFGPASTISLIEGEKAPNTYSFSTPRGTLAQNHRQKFGKGTKGRYYALAASGTGECELDGIEPEVHQLTRRI